MDTSTFLIRLPAGSTTIDLSSLTNQLWWSSHHLTPPPKHFCSLLPGEGCWFMLDLKIILEFNSTDIGALS